MNHCYPFSSLFPDFGLVQFPHLQTYLPLLVQEAHATPLVEKIKIELLFEEA